MKFLGIRYDAHDSNITYTNGTQLKYLSTERLYDEKHHGWKNDWSWKSILTKWNIDLKDIDAIALVIDDNVIDKDKVCRSYKEGLHVNGEPIPCPVFVIDHHYAHALSLWPMGEIPEVNYVYDGFGNHNRSQTTFHKDKIIDESISDSLGQILSHVGSNLLKWGKNKKKGSELDYAELDYAGKITGLSAYGIFDSEHAESCNKFSVEELIEIWNPSSYKKQWQENAFNINWLHTCHKISVDKIAEHVLNNDEEVIGWSGGVAQNCVINGKLMSSDKKIVIPPHVNDCGLSIGAVEYLRQYYKQDKFDTTGFPFWQDDEAPPDEPSKAVIKETAKVISEGCGVGWYQGHGEIGPRALGNRSILVGGDVRDAKEFLNHNVKFRENYRPYGAAVLREDVSEHFECDIDVPYMNAAFKVKNPERFPAITHVDGTCRVQTVDGDSHFAELLREYKKNTGHSVVLNTSMNVSGKPICNKLWQAYDLYVKNLGIEYMVIGNDFLGSN
jgi:carbamoyltransferase